MQPGQPHPSIRTLPNPAVGKVGLISSFTLRSLDAVVEHWPDPAVACELYAFMQSDAEEFLPRWFDVMEKLTTRLRRIRQKRSDLPIPKTHHTALDRMAHFADNENVISTTARRINERLGAGSISLVGLASFLPGLALGPGTDTRPNIAFSATRFLIKLAQDIKRTHKGLKSVELVGGSLIKGIECRLRESSVLARLSAVLSDLSVYLFPTEKTLNASLQNHDFFAHCFSPEEAIKGLINSCRALLPEVRKADVRVVFEHEPGFLYVLGDKRRLCSFCSQLQADPDLRPWFGLNLDIAHWGFLSCFNIDNLPSVLLDSCWHSHASSHGVGHFGDAPIDSGRGPCLRRPEEFVRWFENVGWLVPRSQGNKSSLSLERNPSFSGSVCLELEACRDTEMLRRSLANLFDILQMPCPAGLRER